MPEFHGMLERANDVFRGENCGNLDPEDFSADKQLIDSMKAYGIVRPGTKEREILARIPRAMRASIQAIIRANLTRSDDPHSPAEPWTIQWSWAPGIHYELRIMAELGPINGSGGGVSVQLITPLPREARPETY